MNSGGNKRILIKKLERRKTTMKIAINFSIFPFAIDLYRKKC